MAPSAPISLCIPAIYRPHRLEAALRSVAACEPRPAQVVVSDDSPDGANEPLVTRFPGVTYHRGPRLGVGANRAACIDVVDQPYVCYIDDDATVPLDYFATAMALVSEYAPGSVITGWMRNHTEHGSGVVLPGGADHLGFDGLKFGTSRDGDMITMSATVFPRDVFEQVQFDPLLRYGYEELDISRQLRARGFPVVFDPRFWVDHHPDEDRSVGYHSLTDAARLYTGYKSRRWYREQRVQAALWAAMAASHHLVSGALRRGTAGSAAAALRDVRMAASLAKQYAGTAGTREERRARDAPQQWNEALAG